MLTYTWIARLSLINPECLNVMINTRLILNNHTQWKSYIPAGTKSSQEWQGSSAHDNHWAGRLHQVHINPTGHRLQKNPAVFPAKLKMLKYSGMLRPLKKKKWIYKKRSKVISAVSEILGNLNLQETPLGLLSFINSDLWLSCPDTVWILHWFTS